MGARNQTVLVHLHQLERPTVDRLPGHLGARVRELREAHGWSQTDLARRAGMTQPAVARFEAGGTVPTLPVLQRLAQALDASLVVDITTGDPTTDPHPTDTATA